MPFFATQRTWIMSTKNGDGSPRKIDGTASIAISVVFLAYVLHPAIEKAYNRVRAYRAWRAIEKREAVEVTSYSKTSEMFGVRGIWDAARIITFLLAAFSLASWGLELQLDLALIDNGPVYLLNSPPPVILHSSRNDSWEVKSLDELDAEPGSLWNMDDDHANGIARSRYHVENYTFEKVNGDITVAWWSDDVKDRPKQFYNIEGFKTVVHSLDCNSEPKNVSIFVEGEDTPWGTVYECEEGPVLSAALLKEVPNKSKSPPTIIMNETATSHAYIIVEESSRYPSFLYSVWTSGGVVEDGVEIDHLFHIASTMRLVEAVVTGIVHGLENGGGCFGLLRQYSESNFKNETLNVPRASPFGETPEFGTVDTLGEVEAIEAGVEVSIFVLLCAVWLMVLTSIGFAWSLCLRKSIGMDIYNRDELIRAVSMPVTGTREDANNSKNTPPPSSIRIFVRKGDAGHMSVAVSEAAKGEGLFERLFRRGGTVKAIDEPAPVTAATTNDYNAGFGGAVVPVGPRTVWLEGQTMRAGMARAFPGRQGNFLYPSISLTTSPVPSTIGSLAGTLAQACSPVPAGHDLVLGRGPSVLFDSGYSLGSSGGEEDAETGCGIGGAVGDRGGVGNSNLVACGETYLARSALGMGVTTGRRPDREVLMSLRGKTMTVVRGGSSSVPSRGLTTDLTQGLPRFPRLPREASERMGSTCTEEEVKENGTKHVSDGLV